MAGGGKLKDLAWRAGGVSWLMLLVLFRHSTARWLRQALWQFTPQAEPGAPAQEEQDGGRERCRERGRGRRGRRRRGRERRRERRRDGKKGERGQEWGEDRERGGERGRGSDRGTGTNRDGRASGDRTVLLHAMQTHEHWQTHTVRLTVPDNNSVNQGRSKRRGDGSSSNKARKHVRVKGAENTVSRTQTHIHTNTHSHTHTHTHTHTHYIQSFHHGRFFSIMSLPLSLPP